MDRNRRRASIAVLLTVAALSACRTPQLAAAPPRAKVHRFTPGEGGIFANGYLVEGGAGVVAVDSALTVSGGRALRAQLDALQKPLLAVLLTHGHPDHYNGVAALVEGHPEVPVLATASVAKVIGDSDAAKEKQWRPVFGDEWPVKRVFPTRIVRDGETVVFDGLSFSVHELGPGESHADTYWVMDSDARDVFLGDEVFEGMHAYLSDGHSTAWLANLDRLERALGGVRSIYPGHGEPGGLGLIVSQRAYLDAYRAGVRAHLAPGAKVLAPEEKKAFVAGMLARYPAARVTFLVELGADPVAGELSGEH